MQWLRSMGNIFIDILVEISRIFYESSLFLLFGFLLAGVLHEFISMRQVSRRLGGKNLTSIFWAAVLGAPLPICSCGVLPAAATLRKKGASKPATASFIVSVPETGVDSIAVSYGLMGPFMALYRPLVALVSATVTGLAVAFITRKETDNEVDLSPEQLSSGHVDAGHHHHHSESHNHSHSHSHDHDHGFEDDDSVEVDKHHKARMRRIFHYGFVRMLDDIAFWVIAGLLITGIMLALLPDDFFASTLGWDAGIVPMLVMAIIGVPLYTCASMSTPLAAGLIVSGLSPGAALVYLLTGPGTSIASMSIIGRMLGRRVLWTYLGAIIVVAISAGLLLDAYAADLVRDAARTALNEPEGWLLSAIKTTAAVVLVVLVLFSLRRKSYREPLADLRGQYLSLASGIWRVRKPLAGVVSLIAIVLIFPFFTLQVAPGHTGMILNFGRVAARDLPPGLYFHLPWPLSQGMSVNSSEIRQLIVNAEPEGAEAGVEADRSGTYLTIDENIISLTSVITYRIDDAYQYQLQSEHNEALLQSLAQRVLVTEAMQRPIDAIFTVDRANMEEHYRVKLKAAVARLDQGYEIVDARLVYAHAPASVHDAFRDVASALEDMQLLVFDANGDAFSRLSRAEGQAVTIEAEAGAAAAKEISQAKSRAAAFGPLASAHAEYPYITERRLQFEAQERYLAAPKKYINVTRNMDGVDLWIDPNADDVLKFKFKN